MNPRITEASRAPGCNDDQARVAGGPPESGARTPEELETLLEDAIVLRDSETLTSLFMQGATLEVGSERPARGPTEIARLALEIWNGERIYVAAPRYVIQARDSALIVTEQTVNVARRGDDGSWRYAIVHLSVDHL